MPAHHRPKKLPYQLLIFPLKSKINTTEYQRSQTEDKLWFTCGNKQADALTYLIRQSLAIKLFNEILLI